MLFLNELLSKLMTLALSYTFKYVVDTSAVNITHESFNNSLQKTTDTAASWSSSMNMQHNAKKTKELVLDFNIPNYDFPQISINSEIIERVTSIFQNF